MIVVEQLLARVPSLSDTDIERIRRALDRESRLRNKRKKPCNPCLAKY